MCVEGNVNKDGTHKKELITRLQSGDRDAFAEIYNLHSDNLLGKLKFLLPDENLALDVLQNTFIRLWEFRGKLEPNKDEAGLIFQIARNLVMDYYRNASVIEKNKKHFIDHARRNYDLIEPQSDIEDSIALLYTIIEKLPPKRREVFISCKLEGHSYKIAAEIHGISVGTVKDHMAKAMRFIKEEMKRKPFLTLALIDLFLTY